MLDNIFLVHILERKVLDAAVQMPSSVEDLLHGVDHGSAHYVREGGFKGSPHLFNDFFHAIKDLVPLVYHHYVLELVDDENHRLILLGSYPVRHPEYFQKVIFVRVPVEGKDFVGIGETVLVEDKVGVPEIFEGIGGILGWG